MKGRNNRKDNPPEKWNLLSKRKRKTRNKTTKKKAGRRRNTHDCEREKRLND